jgi:hypothetical protein
VNWLANETSELTRPSDGPCEQCGNGSSASTVVRNQHEIESKEVDVALLLRARGVSPRGGFAPVSCTAVIHHVCRVARSATVGVVGPCQVYGDNQQAAQEQDQRAAMAVPLTARTSRRQVSATLNSSCRCARIACGWRHKADRSELAASTPSRQCRCQSRQWSVEWMSAWCSGGASHAPIALPAPGPGCLT